MIKFVKMRYVKDKRRWNPFLINNDADVIINYAKQLFKSNNQTDTHK